MSCIGEGTKDGSMCGPCCPNQWIHVKSRLVCFLTCSSANALHSFMPRNCWKIRHVLIVLNGHRRHQELWKALYMYKPFSLIHHLKQLHMLAST